MGFAWRLLLVQRAGEERCVRLLPASRCLCDCGLPAVIKLGELQAVLQRLLAERVPILDLERIVETLGDWAPHTKDPDVLLEYVRNALGRTITARLATDEADGTRRIRALAIAPELEAELTAGI